MTLQEIDAALAAMNADIDRMKNEARVLSRQRDRVIAIAKIAAMPQAEKDALLAAAKGE